MKGSLVRRSDLAQARSSRLGTLVALVALVSVGVATVALAWPAVGAFVDGDDDAWLAWSSRPLGEVVAGRGAPFETCRPAFALVMAVEQRLFGDAYGAYRLLGLAAHVVGGLLLFALCRPWAGTAGSWLAASTFLLLPVHYEALFWISGRAEVFSGVAVLATLVALDRARRTDGRAARIAWMTGAVLSATAAPLFKETGLVVIPLAAAHAAVASAARSRVRETVVATLAALPAAQSLYWYATLADRTSRVGSAFGHAVERVVWSIPGLLSLAWPLPLEEIRTQAYWAIGPAAKGLALTSVILMPFAWVAMRRAGRGPAGHGLVLLLVGSIPFFLLSQPRLLYAASFGFAVLVGGLAGVRGGKTAAAILLLAWAWGFHHHAVLWREACDVGEAAWTQLREPPARTTLLVDYPIQVGGVTARAAGVTRFPLDHGVQIVAPLRVGRASAFTPSRIEAGPGFVRVEREMRWGDHLNYPCSQPPSISRPAVVRAENCRGDASESIVATWSDEAEPVEILRYDGRRFVPALTSGRRPPPPASPPSGPSR